MSVENVCKNCGEVIAFNNTVWFHRYAQSPEAQCQKAEPDALVVKETAEKISGEWIDCKVRLPKMGQPVLCYGRFSSNNYFADCEYLLCCLTKEGDGKIVPWIEQEKRHNYFRATHWLELPAPPPPPQPEKSECEKAMDAYLGQNKYPSLEMGVAVRNAYKSAWNAAKTGGGV